MAKPKTAKSWFDKGETFLVFEKGIDGLTDWQVREATACFNEAVALDPDYHAAWMHLAALYDTMAYQSDGNYPEIYLKAIRAAREACRIDPTDYDGWSSLAGLLSRLANATDPDDTFHAWLRPAVDQLYGGDRGRVVADVLAAYDGELTATPKRWSRPATTLSLKGYLLESVGRHAEAVAAFERALAADPAADPTSRLFAIGTAYAAAGDPARAAAALDRIDWEGPAVGGAMREQYAEALEQAGRSADALAQYERVLPEAELEVAENPGLESSRRSLAATQAAIARLRR